MTSIQCQPLIIDWQQCYGPRDNNEGCSISKIGYGYALFCCITYSYPALPDWWLVKADSLGSIIWSKTYGGNDYEYAAQIKATSDGGFILSGTTFSWDIQGYHGSADYWVVKVDSLGNIQWQKCLGGSGFDFLRGIDLTSDSGYICVGYTESNDSDVTGYHGMDDFWVVRLDKNGNIKWEKCYGGSDFDEPDGVTVTSDGGAIICGQTNSTDGDVHFNLHGGGPTSEAWIVKIDSSGQIQWEQCYGGSDYDAMKIALPLMEGGYICAGMTKSNDGQVSGNHGNEDFWIIKIDHSGNLLWQKCYGGSRDEEPYCMKESSDGNYIIGGYTYSNDGDVSGNHSMQAGLRDMWIIKISPEGDLIWQQCIGGNGDEALEDFLDLSNGNLLLLGYTESTHNSGDVTCKFHEIGEMDAWLVAVTDTTYTGIYDRGKEGYSINIYPNPTYNLVTFELSGLKPKDHDMILITDELGRLVEKIKPPASRGKVIWNAQNNKSGVYYYQAAVGNTFVNGKIILIK